MNTTTQTAAHRWREKMKDAQIREDIDAVFAVDLAGARWLMATNGQELVAEQSDEDAPAWPMPAEKLETLLGGEIIGRASTKSLREWAGDPEYPSRTPCDECGGTGMVDHDCDCDLCREYEEACGCFDGMKESVPAFRPGWIGAAVVDRNKVARLMENLNADEEFTIRIRPHASAPGYYIAFVAPQQLALLASLSYDPEKHDAAPRLPLEGP